MTINAGYHRIECPPAPGLAILAGVLLWSSVAVQPLAAEAGRATNAVLGQPLTAPAILHRSRNTLDRDDYYWLADGRKARFRRVTDTYVLLRKSRSASADAVRRNIENRFDKRVSTLRSERFKRHVLVRIGPGEAHTLLLDAIRNADPAIEFVSPLLTDAAGDAEIAVLPKVIVRFTPSADYSDLIELVSTEFALNLSARLEYTEHEFEFEMVNPVNDVSEVFALSRYLSQKPYIDWSEPVMVTPAKPHFTPNDPLYINQWHLQNTGQNGALAEADINAENGWDISRGNGTVIAIVDDAVQTGHPDLVIQSNPGESGDGKESNGLDDDANGYIDDHQGWDFDDNDNDPNPETGNHHGTAVAGGAAASGDNLEGVTGSAIGASILPVRVGNMSCTDWGRAVRYAAKYADVVSNSWSINGCQNALDAAIADAVNGAIPGARRGAKGTPVLFASGNDASGWRRFTLSGFPGGSYTFRWEFRKDAIVSSGYDTVWLDDIAWPGGAVTDFESDAVGAVPSGFGAVANCGQATNSGDWTVVSDGIHARGAVGNAVQAAAIDHDQTTCLETLRSVGAGQLRFWVWVSSEQNFDFFRFYVNDTLYFQYAPGQYGHRNEVAYPASNPNTIAVGGSEDGGISGLEERVYYSQFGPELDVVAPTSGDNQGITTTDRTGADGYDPSAYTSSFGGTSAAAPLAAGVVADVVALAPFATASQIRNALRAGADPIGPYPYSGGRNDFYGFGRVDLPGALQYLGTTVPSQVVLRSEAAKPLLEAKGIIPGGAVGIFADVAATDFNAAWIETLYDLGIAQPCLEDSGVLYFCPQMALDKTQAARILLRAGAMDPATYAPPAAATAVFDDVDIGAPGVAGDGDFAADWIVEFANLGYSEGCDASNYCPGEAVTWETWNAMMSRVFP